MAWVEDTYAELDRTVGEGGDNTKKIILIVAIIVVAYLAFKYVRGRKK